MSFPRIERAEVLTFRLVVPKGVVESVADHVPELGLVVCPRPGGVCLEIPNEGSSLTFRCRGEACELAAMVLVSDPEGLFFRSVLVPLLVRHRGDFHARLSWSEPGGQSGSGERGVTEVLLERGALPPSVENVVDLLRAATRPLFAPATPESAEFEESREVEHLLEKAREDFARYRKPRAIE